MEFRTAPFAALGVYLKHHPIPEEIMWQAEQENHTFTPYYMERAVCAIRECLLSGEGLSDWVKPYHHFTRKYESAIVIMAGNIPLVGFLDMMACSVCGLKTYIKPSSKDRVLMNWIVSLLEHFGCNNLFEYTESTQAECVIATGSNNANRYFDMKFGHLPSVIRGSRSSIAILTGDESDEDIHHLWHDLFDYFGLGCRNVSHLLVPQNYDIQALCDRLSHDRINDMHYLNAYRQNKALKIMNGEPFFDGGYFIATVSRSLQPTIGEITISCYDEEVLRENSDQIQCVVGKNHLPLGEAQKPTLRDWPDNINLFDFLLRK